MLPSKPHLCTGELPPQLQCHSSHDVLRLHAISRTPRDLQRQCIPAIRKLGFDQCIRRPGTHLLSRRACHVGIRHRRTIHPPSPSERPHNPKLQPLLSASPTHPTERRLHSPPSQRQRPTNPQHNRNPPIPRHIAPKQNIHPMDNNKQPKRHNRNSLPR